jgi:nicotinate-nucleotide adenylyltransferase
MNIAIFGGSFNPVHIGHVALVVHLIEAQKLDKVYVIPAAQSPFKKNNMLVSDIHRLKMCKLAFKGIPQCEVLDVELKRTPPSYTIDTIQELISTKRVGTKDRLFLIVGQDQLSDFAKWKAPDAILAKATLLVAKRAGYHRESQKGSIFVDTPVFEVSSSDIRNRILTNQIVIHLLPHTVYTYITRHSLYHE